MRDLKEITQDVLYENYRTEKLSEATGLEEEPEDPASITVKPPKELKEKQQVELDQQLEQKRQELQNKQAALKDVESK